MLTVLIISIHALAPAAAEALPPAFFQAHRGGLDEVPENTLAAFRHAWAIPGAVPEVDIRTTQDGVMVAFHDETPKRTTSAPAEWQDKNIRDIPHEQIASWDAGSYFGAAYQGARVPTLEQVLDLMLEEPERQLYLDIKDVDLDQLEAALDKPGILERVIFVHGDPAMCATLSKRFGGARTMTWLSGPAFLAKSRFDALEAKGFPGISQIQFHLKPKGPGKPYQYVLDDAYLREAAKRAAAHGAALQVRPFLFDNESLTRLRGLGIQWFVADAPRAFAEALASQPKQAAAAASE